MMVDMARASAATPSVPHSRKYFSSELQESQLTNIR
jgi:hypothetical protein